MLNDRSYAHHPSPDTCERAGIKLLCISAFPERAGGQEPSLQANPILHLQPPSPEILLHHTHTFRYRYRNPPEPPSCCELYNGAHVALRLTTAALHC